MLLFAKIYSKRGVKIQNSLAGSFIAENLGLNLGDIKN